MEQQNRNNQIRSFSKSEPSKQSATRNDGGKGPRPQNSNRSRGHGNNPHRNSQRGNNHGNRSQHQNNRSNNQHHSQKQKAAPIPPPEKDVIRVVPLGGVEQIGKNMTAIELNGDIVVVDSGFAFTDENTPGIDYILPNTTYLEERKDQIKGLVITHGHLDHIGGLPFILDRIGNPPVYTREFGSYIIKKRQEEFPNKPALNLKVITAKEGAIKLSDNFKIRFFGLTHSIPDSTGVIVETPFGDIVNTGDVRIDNIEGVPTETEQKQWEFFKDRNVLLMTMDSTNIDRPGWSLSESIVAKTVDQIIKDAQGRLIIATFASQVERILEFLKSAKKYDKKVVIEGRSMKTNVGIVEHLELTDTSHIIPMHEMDNYPPHKVMILATGAQGEEFAALMRIANDTHKNVRLNETDTIVLSSSVIPGNDKAVQNLKDHLYRHDAKIITYLDSDVHASGHGKREELAWIHQQIPYKFFMPVHGHHYMLKLHREMVMKLGVPKENIVVPDNGSIIEISNEGKEINVRKERAPHEDLYVEGGIVGAAQDVVINDRKMLSQDGIVVILALVNTKTGTLKKSPDIASRGFVYLRESKDVLNSIRSVTKKTVEKSTQGNRRHIDFNAVRKNVTRAVGKTLFQKTQKKPVVVSIVVGV